MDVVQDPPVLFVRACIERSAENAVANVTNRHATAFGSGNTRADRCFGDVRSSKSALVSRAPTLPFDLACGSGLWRSGFERKAGALDGATFLIGEGRFPFFAGQFTRASRLRLRLRLCWRRRAARFRFRWRRRPTTGRSDGFLTDDRRGRGTGGTMTRAGTFECGDELLACGRFTSASAASLDDRVARACDGCLLLRRKSLLPAFRRRPSCALTGLRARSRGSLLRRPRHRLGSDARDLCREICEDRATRVCHPETPSPATEFPS